MSRFNRIPPPEGHESPAALRYSFASEDMFRTDMIVQGREYPARVLAYPTPPEKVLPVRAAMMERGFVLGKQLESNDPDVNRFEIPMSAHPVEYDTATTAGGNPHEYGDMELFFDLGKIMGVLACQGEELPLALNDVLGKNIATREFTREGERRVLLVPGFELSLNEVADDDAALAIYMERLQSEFEPRFEPNVANFVDGFYDGLGGE